MKDDNLTGATGLAKWLAGSTLISHMKVWIWTKLNNNIDIKHNFLGLGCRIVAAKKFLKKFFFINLKIRLGHSNSLSVSLKQFDLII